MLFPPLGYALPSTKLRSQSERRVALHLRGLVKIRVTPGTSAHHAAQPEPVIEIPTAVTKQLWQIQGQSVGTDNANLDETLRHPKHLTLISAPRAKQIGLASSALARVHNVKRQLIVVPAI